MVVAKGVQRMPATAVIRGKGKRQAEAPQQEAAEEVWFQRGGVGCRERIENSGCVRSRLHAQQITGSPA
jgi:hypothetical protein